MQSSAELGSRGSPRPAQGPHSVINRSRSWDWFLGRYLDSWIKILLRSNWRRATQGRKWTILKNGPLPLVSLVLAEIRANGHHLAPCLGDRPAVPTGMQLSATSLVKHPHRPTEGLCCGQVWVLEGWWSTFCTLSAVYLPVSHWDLSCWLWK